MEKKPKLPKSLGACADLLYQTRERRLALQKEAEDLGALEASIKSYLIDSLPKSEALGVAGKLARVTIRTKVVPQVQDWDAFWKYVKKNNATDLIQRRLSAAAIEERWESGKEVPGVGHFNAVTVSINKV